MRLRDFLRAPKRVTDVGKWTSGKAAKKLLELSKGSLSLGAQWTWRRIVLECEGREYVVVIALHEAKQNYCAHLAAAGANARDTLVLASIENHGTHPGWHVHANCSGEGGANVGRLRYPAQIRLPAKGSKHRLRAMRIREDEALKPVLEFFRLDTVTDDNNTQSLW
jgi:hypothetical protein